MKFNVAFMLAEANIKELRINRLIENESIVELNTSDSTRFVSYSSFGAKGDGVTDDLQAIAATHEYANEHNLRVEADSNAKYYIGGKEHTAVIMTDTDFGNAEFIIDDTNVEEHSIPVFIVNPTHKGYRTYDINRLDKKQSKIDIPLPQSCLIVVTDSNIKRFIRFGANKNQGNAQTDLFVVDKDGNINQDTPLIWDFPEVTNALIFPIDEKTLTITGGYFTTIANKEESKYNYYNRGITIRRSNVLIDGIEHRVIKEGKSGAPYSGFLNIKFCSDITIKNSVFTGRKIYKTIGASRTEVNMGTYDININRANNVKLENCTQTNDINDRNYWGIMASNYSKNILYDNCILSRFDAHQGVTNATILNSILGWGGINLIGGGTFTLKNSTIISRFLISLRSDYGSTWNGDFLIQDCVFQPTELDSKSLIGGYNSGKHNFGYQCYMPRKISIHNLHIDDSNYNKEYKGPVVLSNFTNSFNDGKFSIKITEKLIISGISTSSGKFTRVSNNLSILENIGSYFVCPQMSNN